MAKGGQIMRKFIVPLIVIGLLFCAVEGYAVDLFSVGSSGNNNLYKITSTAIVEGKRGDYERFSSTTTNTLTAIESGLTSIAAADCAFTLPTASLGLEYTFVNEGDDGPTATVADRTDIIKVKVAATDTIKYSTSGTGFTIGQSINSQGITGDSLTLISGSANTWHVKSINGTWTAGN